MFHSISKVTAYDNVTTLYAYYEGCGCKGDVHTMTYRFQILLDMRTDSLSSPVSAKGNFRPQLYKNSSIIQILCFM
jgi:hypothetical protein